LAWGLFTGIAFVLIPLVTDGWGNTISFLVGIGLIIASGAGLIRIGPRRTPQLARKSSNRSEASQ